MSKYRGYSKTKIQQPYTLATPLSRIYLKESKSAFNRDTCSAMFIVALLTLDRLWNRPGPHQPKRKERKCGFIYIYI
jgi:hypothetical protein